MTRFTLNRRVRVTEPLHALHGRTGRVVKPLLASATAWVEIDGAVPEGSRTWPRGHERANWVLLAAEYCEEVA